MHHPTWCFNTNLEQGLAGGDIHGPQIGTAEQALMARVKQAFDPAGILNPGKAI